MDGRLPFARGGHDSRHRHGGFGTKTETTACSLPPDLSPCPRPLASTPPSGLTVPLSSCETRVHSVAPYLLILHNRPGRAWWPLRTALNPPVRRSTDKCQGDSHGGRLARRRPSPPFCVRVTATAGGGLQCLVCSVSCPRLPATSGSLCAVELLLRALFRILCSAHSLSSQAFLCILKLCDTILNTHTEYSESELCDKSPVYILRPNSCHTVPSRFLKTNVPD